MSITGTDLDGADPHPTVVNNVETLSNVPHILAHGADWFRGMGTEASPGTIVTTVVGDVIAPDVGEVELGTPLSTVIDVVGSGLNDIEAGLRLRYEIERKVAPYVGVSWTNRFSTAADFARAAGEDASEVYFVFGLRLWR